MMDRLVCWFAAKTISYIDTWMLPSIEFLFHGEGIHSKIQIEVSLLPLLLCTR
jgi:hypothetical protein